MTLRGLEPPGRGAVLKRHKPTGMSSAKPEFMLVPACPLTCFWNVLSRRTELSSNHKCLCTAMTLTCSHSGVTGAFSRDARRQGLL